MKRPSRPRDSVPLAPLVFDMVVGADARFVAARWPAPSCHG